MLDEWINGFYYGLLLPLSDGWKILLWSHKFYFSFPLLFLLSIPAAIIRSYQAINKNAKHVRHLEGFVWLFRLVQFAFIIHFVHKIPVDDLFSKQVWHTVTQMDAGHLYRFLHLLHPLGFYNVIIYFIFHKKWTAKVMKKVWKHPYQSEPVRLAMITGIKNLLLIPIAVIYLLHI